MITTVLVLIVLGLAVAAGELVLRIADRFRLEQTRLVMILEEEL